MKPHHRPLGRPDLKYFRYQQGTFLAKPGVIFSPETVHQLPAAQINDLR
jgi:hypothetical protein